MSWNRRTLFWIRLSTRHHVSGTIFAVMLPVTFQVFAYFLLCSGNTRSLRKPHKSHRTTFCIYVGLCNVKLLWCWELTEICGVFGVDFRPKYRNTSDMSVSFVGVIRVRESREIYRRIIDSSDVKERALRFERGGPNCVAGVVSEWYVCPELALHKP